MRVLALDPGDRVGWARADVADDGEWSGFRHGITPLKDMALAIHDATGSNDFFRGESSYDLIVVEDWRLYPQQAKTMIGSSFPSVQFIGMVRMCCWLSGTKLVMQGASLINSNDPTRESTADRSMKALWPEMYEFVSRPIRHDDGHDLSAIKHLWIWTFKNTAIGTTKETV